MPDLVHCIYASVQTHVLSPSELDALVQHSQRKNREKGITGVLLHVGASFFQILEGPRAEVSTLYDNILQDARHTKITSIIFEPIAKRYFGDVTMSLATLSPGELAQVLEADDTEQVEKLLTGLDEGRAKRLLRAFSQGRWRARLGAQISERQSVA